MVWINGCKVSHFYMIIHVYRGVAKFIFSLIYRTQKYFLYLTRDTHTYVTYIYFDKL